MSECRPRGIFPGCHVRGFSWTAYARRGKGTAFVRGRTRRRFRNSAFIGLGLAILVLGVGFEELVRVRSPPPFPAEAGTLRLPPRSVTWLPGVGTRNYGPCMRMLAIDGGGRGIIPALILAEIEKRTGKPIAAQFDP
jgi:hypothetical protein